MREDTRTSRTLAQEISVLLRDQERLDRLGAAGRARWRERFTWNGIAALYEDLFAGSSILS